GESGRRVPVASSSSVAGCAGADEPGLICEDHSVYTVAEVELREQTGDVRLDCGRLDDELRRDLGVREAPGEQLEHVVFTGGELVEDRCSGGRAGGLLDELAGATRS